MNMVSDNSLKSLSLSHFNKNLEIFKYEENKEFTFKNFENIKMAVTQRKSTE